MYDDVAEVVYGLVLHMTGDPERAQALARDALLAVALPDGQTVEAATTAMAGVIGEKIELGRGVTVRVVRFNHSGDASNPIQHFARELYDPPTPDANGGLRAGVGEENGAAVMESSSRGAQRALWRRRRQAALRWRTRLPFCGRSIRLRAVPGQEHR